MHLSDEHKLLHYEELQKAKKQTTTSDLILFDCGSAYSWTSTATLWSKAMLRVITDKYTATVHDFSQIGPLLCSQIMHV